VKIYFCLQKTIIKEAVALKPKQKNWRTVDVHKNMYPKKKDDNYNETWRNTNDTNAKLQG